MVRSTMYVAAWMLLGAVAPAWAQECTDTYDATAIGLRGRLELSVLFEPGDPMTGVQTGSLLITSLDTTTLTLPELSGVWLAMDRCQFSIWHLTQPSVGGRATGSGITFGDQLFGVIQVRGFQGSANGVFLVTGEGAVEEPPVNPPMEETPSTAAAQLPTPATRRGR